MTTKEEYAHPVGTVSKMMIEEAVKITRQGLVAQYAGDLDEARKLYETARQHYNVAVILDDADTAYGEANRGTTE